MIIKEAEFVVSNTTYEKCPKPDMPEYAFIGRSNVGKSSLINMLCNRKAMAKTSATPGKTQLINHFIIDQTWYLVDLPGYGFARTSKSSLVAWDKMIRDYLEKRMNLMTTFVLIDVRHEPQKIDVAFINWLGTSQIPFTIVFTKTDKISKQQVDSSVAKYKRELKKTWDELPNFYISSAEKNIGRDVILDFITQANAEFIKPEKK